MTIKQNGRNVRFKEHLRIGEREKKAKIFKELGKSFL